MQAQPHYPNAPITEAIIDLRVTPSKSVGLEQLGGTRLGEELSYPESVPIFNASGEITIMPGGPPSFSATDPARVSANGGWWEINFTVKARRIHV